MLTRLFYLFSLCLLWNLCFNTHNFQTGSSGDRVIIFDENSLAYEIYSAEESPEYVNFTFSELNFRTQSGRHSTYAFKRKNSNHKIPESAKFTKTNFSIFRSSLYSSHQNFVDQSFLKSLRISKMLC